MKKILAWCDFAVPTGFGIVSKKLLEGLVDHYEIHVAAISYYGGNYESYDSRIEVYPGTKTSGIFNIPALFHYAKKLQPEIIFLFQDLFNISDVIKQLKELSPNSKIITYFPIDGGPLNDKWKNVLELSDQAITYTDWANQMLLTYYGKKIHTLYHGVDTSIFTPMEYTDLYSERENRGFNNRFVLLNVNRYQPRKGIPLTMLIYSMFANGYRKCPECGHIMPLNEERCTLNNCISQLEKRGSVKEDVLLYLHMNNIEPTMGQTYSCSLEGMAETYGVADKVIIRHTDIYVKPMDDKDLNILYNIANINISTTFGEGCGLSLIESQAVGTPSVAPNNSAIPEMIGKTGVLVKNKGVIALPKDNSFIRPVVDVEAYIKALDILYFEWKSQGVQKQIKFDCIENIEENFLWDDKISKLIEIIEL